MKKPMIFSLAAILVMALLNVFLLYKIGTLSQEVNDLNEAYSAAVESLKEITELADGLPTIPQQQ